MGGGRLPAMACEPGGKGRDEGGDVALHVGGTPAVEHAVADFRAEGIGAPGAGAGGNDVSVAGEAERGAPLADARVEVPHAPVCQLGAGEAEPAQRLGEHGLRARILGRDGGAADQRRGERQRVGEGGAVSHAAGR